MKKFIIFISLLFLNNSILANDPYPINGKTYILSNNMEFYIDVIQIQSNYSNIREGKCILTTSYKGKTGIYISIVPNQAYYPRYVIPNTSIFIHNNESFNYKIGGTTTSYFPFYQPILHVFYYGCSIYGDGDICREAKSNNTDIALITCSYNTSS